MSSLGSQIAERIRRELRRLLPIWVIGQAWFELLLANADRLAGSGG